MTSRADLGSIADLGAVAPAPASDVSHIEFESRPSSLALSVYNAIRLAIIDGNLPADTRVTEAGIAKQLQVSKTPVREALLRLKEVGLIESVGPRAARIVSSSQAHMRDAYEVRESLEATSARLAAERGSEEALLVAKRAADRTMDAAIASDISAYRTADAAFHAAVAVAGGNPRLCRLIDDVNALVSVLRQRDIPGVDGSVTCAQQHLSIVDALLERDADKATALMVEHVRHVAREVQTHVGDVPPTSG